MTKNEIVHYAGHAQSDLASFKAGGVVRSGKGDRINIKMPNGRLITIPVSGDLKIGLLKSAIRKAGLDDAEFMMLLEGLG